MPKPILAWLLSCLLCACTTIHSPQERKANADALASAKGWEASRLATGRFDLVSYAPRDPRPAETLTLYIEGDGFAWGTGSLPSTDPTPRDPLALRLALSHPTGNAAYLARPCQYVDAEKTGCPQRYWTAARFAPEVVNALNRMVDAMKQRFGARQLVLVGYSGGGAVAALLAARRDDVVHLVTVAGNLDHRAWTTYHRVAPMSPSLNAADYADRLALVPQTHFIGGKDRVISPELAMRWPKEMTGIGHANLHVISDFDHACCWAGRWAALLPRD